MNPYLRYVEGIQAGFEAARGLTVSGRKAVAASTARVVLFSPHPDDECLTGLLPLRLMREGGKQIVNVPVTHGSDAVRRAARAQELADACAYLGWELHVGAQDQRALDVADITRVLERLQPEIVVMPHARDWNTRHIATHRLVVDALRAMPDAFSCTVVETEYWAAMDDPNLMVEGDAVLVAELVAATSLHVGEVARNPYHLRLPAWMQDNVRRGGELVGGQGSEAPSLAFATLYRLRRWRQGELVDVLERGTILPVGAAGLRQLF